jgi:hypothetical protein
MKRTHRKQIQQVREANEGDKRKLDERLDYADKRLTDVLEKLKAKLNERPKLKVVK